VEGGAGGVGHRNAGSRWIGAASLTGRASRALRREACATTAYNAGNQVMVGEPRWYEVVWQRRF